MDITSGINQTLRDFIALNLDTDISVYLDGAYDQQTLPKILISSTSANEIPALPLNFTTEIIVE